jgi:hypothetical protein
MVMPGAKTKLGTRVDPNPPAGRVSMRINSSATLV